MKISKLIFLFVLAVAAVGCNKDDDNDSVEPYKLSTTNFVDTYKLKFLEVKEVETITFGNGTTSTSTSTTVGSVFQNVNFAFTANNTYTANGLFNTVTTVANADGTIIVGDTVIINLDETGTYSLNTTNSKLTVTDDGGEVTSFEIRDYTETGMTLYSEETTITANSSTTTTVEYRYSR
jgi:threonine aldolase